jgi:hypothetical protein
LGRCIDRLDVAHCGLDSRSLYWAVGRNDDLLTHLAEVTAMAIEKDEVAPEPRNAAEAQRLAEQYDDEELRTDEQEAQRIADEQERAWEMYDGSIENLDENYPYRGDE